MEFPKIDENELNDFRECGTFKVDTKTYVINQAWNISNIALTSVNRNKQEIRQTMINSKGEIVSDRLGLCFEGYDVLWNDIK